MILWFDGFGAQGVEGGEERGVGGEAVFERDE